MNENNENINTQEAAMDAETTTETTTTTVAVADATASKSKGNGKAKTKKAKKSKTSKPSKKANASGDASPKAPGKPGRPAYNPKFPRKSAWTMTDFCVANEVDPSTGKGPRCSKLTLIKWLGRDSAKKGRSMVKRLDTTAAPNSESGMGRKAFLYSLREKIAGESKADMTVPAVSVSTETAQPEAVNAAQPEAVNA